MHDANLLKYANPPSARDREIHRVLSAFGNLKGREAERRIIHAWRPRWRNRRRYGQVFNQVRLASAYEDEVLKWDVIFETKIKTMPFIGLQVKTSRDDWLQFAKKYPRIPLIRLSDFDSDNMIRKRSLIIMLVKFPNLAEEMEKLGCTISRRAMKTIAEVSPDDLVEFI